MSAITDYTGNLVLDFVDYRIDKEPKYDVAECKERMLLMRPLCA